MTGPQRREQLLGVARDVFAERGYAATTMEEIAERAEVSKPVVYEHFGSKDDAFGVVVDREVVELSSRMAAAIAVDDPRAAGESAALAFLGYVEEEEAGFRVLLHDGPVGVATGSLASIMSDVAVRVEELLLRDFREGFDHRTVPMYARMLVGAVAGVGEWWLEASHLSRDEVAAHVVNLLWNGLRRIETTPTLTTVGLAAGGRGVPVAVRAPHA
jgi:AcrR family transcriptional regulator